MDFSINTIQAYLRYRLLLRRIDLYTITTNELESLLRRLIVDSRLAEKLKAAGEVAARQHAKIEQRADAVIAREADIEKKTEEAFSPHESILDDTMSQLDQLEKMLAGVTNNPLPKSSPGAVKDANGDTATKPIITNHQLATDKQGHVLG